MRSWLGRPTAETTWYSFVPRVLLKLVIGIAGFGIALTPVWLLMFFSRFRDDWPTVRHFFAPLLTGCVVIFVEEALMIRAAHRNRYAKVSRSPC